MTWNIYILYSERFKKSYVGCSEDIEARLNSHNSGKVASTKRFIPWRIIYSEEVGTYLEVRKREKYFKSGAGRRKMKIIFDELGLNK